MQEQAVLLPGSQAGEEGTRRLVTRCWLLPPYLHPPSLPPFFTLFFHSVFPLWFSSSRSVCHILFPYGFHLCVLLPPTQAHTDSHGGKERRLPLEGEGTSINKHTRFLTGSRMFPRSKDIFTCHWHGLRSEQHSFYICRLCLSKVVEVGHGSCV